MYERWIKELKSGLFSSEKTFSKRDNICTNNMILVANASPFREFYRDA